jgi:putative N6-adenine-specific DNA methylase
VNDLSLFLPCAAGVESYLATEVATVLQRPVGEVHAARAGVSVQASWRDVLLLNLHVRLAQRVLVRLRHGNYRSEDDIYALAREVPWELWFGVKQTFKVDLTAQRSPLKSLNFAALRVKDALVDRFRDREGERPSVEVRWPDVRVHVHLTTDQISLFIDTSGEPLFKRGWREDKGDAPLKETLAAAMLAACGWSQSLDGAPTGVSQGLPMYDPCCGSGTIAIEAAQIACGMAPGAQRGFGFEKLRPHDRATWQQMRQQALAAVHAPMAEVHGSDVAFRMVDFAQRNAERAEVAQAVHFRGGDALQRLPPTERAGVMLLNPPYGERIEAAGVAGRQKAILQDGDEGEFFLRLAQHWRAHYSGWTAWLLTPDLKLPGRMRLKENRRVPFWNGPIECRMFRFELGRHVADGRAKAT